MITSPRPQARYAGLLPYAAGRQLQDSLVKNRLDGEIGDCFIFCEHPPVITLGKRSTAADLPGGPVSWENRGIEIQRVDRGGGTTFHGPGQLVIYPVVSVQQMGVRRFVEAVFSAVASYLAGLGINSAFRKDAVGLWVGQAKIASAGLRIVHGVTNHGFSLNVAVDTGIFSEFVACGIKHITATSIEREIENTPPPLKEVARALGLKLNCSFDASFE